MNAQVIIGKATFTVGGVDHLKVDGALVELQRSTRDGYETVAVAAEELLVTLEPATCADGRKPGTSEPVRQELPEPAGALVWYPVGDPMD